MGKKKKVTTKDIAEYANVSQSAVSMILNQKPNVSFSEETRQRVFMAAEELGYHKKRQSPHQSILYPKLLSLCVRSFPITITQS